MIKGKVVSIDMLHKAGVIVDGRGHWYVFTRHDCVSGKLPSQDSKVLFEPEQPDEINRARNVSIARKAA